MFTGGLLSDVIFNTLPSASNKLFREFISNIISFEGISQILSKKEKENKYFCVANKRFQMDWFKMSCLSTAMSCDQRCSVKTMFLEISQNSQENACTSVLFLLKKYCNFVKKETGTGVFLWPLWRLMLLVFIYRFWLHSEKNNYNKDLFSSQELYSNIYPIILTMLNQVLCTNPREIS